MSLRHRSNTGRTEATAMPSPQTTTRGGLSLSALLAASPQHSGPVLKLHSSPLLQVLPLCLRKCVLRLWFLSFLRPTWQPRHLVLLGSYMYKFMGSGSTIPMDQTQKPKGAPIAIDGVDVRQMDRNDDKAILSCFCPNPPRGYSTLVCVETLRKKYYFACPSHEDALAWVNSLRDARQEAVTRSMGHAHKDSYPTQWSYFDSLGASLAESKDRIRHRMEQSNLRELEMMHLNSTIDAVSSSAPDGYYS